MCTVSMVSDYYRDKWPERQYPFFPPTVPLPTGPTINQTEYIIKHRGVSRKEFDKLKREVEELKRLLVNAKEIDEKTGQPDCEMEDKVEFLRKIAEFVGVDLSDAIGLGDDQG